MASNSATTTSNPTPASGTTNNNNSNDSKPNSNDVPKFPKSNLSPGNNNSNKGYSYSCTGLLIYSSDRRAKNQLPACIGITGRLKEVELVHDRRKAIKQQHAVAANIAHRKTTIPVRTNEEESFHFSCTGYSRVILQRMRDQQQQQGANSSPFKIKDGKIVGLPICEVGVNMSTVVAHPKPVLPYHTKDLKRSSNTERKEELVEDKKSSVGNIDEDFEKLQEENLDQDIRKIRERYRQVLEQNETDPNTWKRRERLERHRRLLMRQQQQQIEKLKQEQQRQKQLSEEKTIVISKSVEKWKNYSVKLSQLTYAGMKRNGMLIYTELTHKDLPRRIRKSSERIVHHFGSTATLCQKTFSRTKDTLMESLNHYFRKGRGSDKK